MLQRRMFLWSIILLVGAFSLVGCGGNDDEAALAPTPTGTVTKFAILDGAQAGITTTANGTGTLTVDRGTGAVSGFLAIQSAPASAILLAHVHEGARGVSGGPFITLEGPTGATSGTWSVPAGTVLNTAQIASFDAGNLYFAVHTQVNQAGEIRGQIDQTSITLNGRLDGAQEVPAVATNAAGTGSLTVDANTGAVTSGSLTITVAPATPIALAHVHTGDRGVNGGPFITLEGPTGSTSGTWSVPAGTVLSQANKDLFIRGDFYFNVHTGAFGGGEIRGQIDLIAP